jgi:hypothetical protein
LTHVNRGHLALRHSDFRAKESAVIKPSEASPVARVMTAAALFLAGLALWTGLMVERAVWLGRLGPICGHRGLLLTAHCPGCYIAAAMMIGAVALLATTVRQAKPARAR